MDWVENSTFVQCWLIFLQIVFKSSHSSCSKTQHVYIYWSFALKLYLVWLMSGGWCQVLKFLVRGLPNYVLIFSIYHLLATWYRQIFLWFRPTIDFNICLNVWTHKQWRSAEKRRRSRIFNHNVCLVYHSSTYLWSVHLAGLVIFTCTGQWVCLPCKCQHWQAEHV